MKKPVKKCFNNCGAEGHMNFNCPNGKQCHKCSSPSHLARDCPQNKRTDPGQRKSLPGRRPAGMTLGDAVIVPPRPPRTYLNSKKRKKHGTAQSTEENSTSGPANVTSGPTTNTVGPGGASAGPAQLSPSPESVINDAADNIQEINQKLVVKAILMGDSNSRDLPLTDDDDVELDLMKTTVSGLLISEAQTKFDELPESLGLVMKSAVILHVGSCHFPLQHKEEVELLYKDYVQLLDTVQRKCPNARVYVSSIPPRRGYLSSKMNRDIRRLNRRLEELADKEDGLTFINNTIFLSDDKVTLPGLYSAKPDDDIHLATNGKLRVACAMFDHLKNDAYRARAAAVAAEDKDADWSESV